METLDNEFQRHEFRRNTNKIGQLDVLLHTFGGHADIGYMLAQILRDYADYINYLIPYYAASAFQQTKSCLVDMHTKHQSTLLWECFLDFNRLFQGICYRM